MVTDSTLFHPLTEFYTLSGEPLPDAELLVEDQLPPVYRSLLAHTETMPIKLAQHHSQGMNLRVLKTHLDAQAFSRMILLVREDEKVMQLAASKIQLPNFPAEIQKIILEGKVLLGEILRNFNILYVSRPMTFFKVTSDKLMKERMNLSETCTLYGRRSVFMDTKKKTITELLDILVPHE